jgi:hypothetical protein
MSSRVLDKTACYSSAIAGDILKRLDLSNVATVCWWSDAGPHYRAYKFMATVAVMTAEVHKKSSEFHFGLEQHLKGIVDGKYARTTATIKHAALSQEITNIPEYVQVLTAQHEMDRKLCPGPSDEYVDYSPPPKKDVQFYTFRVNTLPAKICTCYSWSFLREAGRVSVFGKGPNALKLTGLRVRANMLSDRIGKTTCVPTVVKCEADEAGAEEVEEPDAAVAAKLCEVGMGVKTWEGWKLSYRLHQPEKRSLKDIRPRMQRKVAPLAGLVTEVSSRHRPKEARIASAVRSNALKSKQGQAKTASLRKLRFG